MKTVAIEDLYIGTVLTFCENLAELGCPKEAEPDMWFRELSYEEQCKVADKMLEIEERYNAISSEDDESMSAPKMVEVEVDLPNDVLLDLSMIAHKQDITLNELCNNILKEIVKTNGECLGRSDVSTEGNKTGER
jgi:hypothetical protein